MSRSILSKGLDEVMMKGTSKKNLNENILKSWNKK